MHEGSQEFLSSVGPNETVPRKIDPDPANSSLFRRTATGDSWVAIQGMLQPTQHLEVLRCASAALVKLGGDLGVRSSI